MKAAFDIGAHHRLEGSAGHAEVCDAWVKEAIVAVGQHISVLVIEQHKPFRNRLDGVDQLLLGAFAVRDILRRSEEADILPIAVILRAQLYVYPACLAVGPYPTVLDPHRRLRRDNAPTGIEKGS